MNVAAVMCDGCGGVEAATGQDSEAGVPAGENLSYLRFVLRTHHGWHCWRGQDYCPGCWERRGPGPARAGIDALPDRATTGHPAGTQP